MHYFKRRQQQRRRAELSDAHGKPRGYHGGCPKATPGFLGTYALEWDDDGTICCGACGAKDLAPRNA